jgi:hypothetical protein
MVDQCNLGVGPTSIPEDILHQIFLSTVTSHVLRLSLGPGFDCGYGYRFAFCDGYHQGHTFL